MRNNGFSIRHTALALLGAAALTALASCQDGDDGADASGVFEVTEVTVSAQTSGELVAFDVEEGMQVRRGLQVGLVDTVQLSLQRRALMASLSATESRRLDEKRQVAALEQQIMNLQAERTRFAALVAEKAATQKQVDDIDHQTEVAQRQLSAAREQVQSGNLTLSRQGESILAQVAQIDDQVRRAHIASPLDGVVLNKYMERGELASAGKPLFKVGDTRHIKLRAYITAPQLTELRLGQRVTVYADRGETGRKAYPGTVVWISDRAEFTPKTIQTRDERANLVYAVKIAVENDGLIKQGMYGDVKF